MKLTQTQKARIYCVKNGHAKYVDTFFGEVYCGRCGDKIGDTLSSVFPLDEHASPNCKNSPCEVCDPIVKELGNLDRKIWDNWIKLYAQDTEADGYRWPSAEHATKNIRFPKEA